MSCLINKIDFPKLEMSKTLQERDRTLFHLIYQVKKYKFPSLQNTDNKTKQDGWYISTGIGTSRKNSVLPIFHLICRNHYGQILFSSQMMQ